MADYIDNQIQIFEKIEKLFDLNRKHLKTIETFLQQDISEILDSFCKKHHLESDSTTSINPTKYYSVKSRVKTTHSLKEKLRRKNLGLKISLQHSLTTENFQTNYKKVKATIFRLDDVIGTRIVTELKADCYKVHDLLKEENEYFIDREIIFNTDELLNQPEKMQNGLPIFRIKGIYKGTYGFELQIKSKIDEAWGDMDHSIFYKDYSVSPIRNTVQVTMNNVGKLLDKIEDLLLGLRDSENQFKEKKEEFDFLQDLTENVYTEVKKKLGDSYELGKIASTLKFIKNKTKVKQKDAKVTDLKYNFLDYEVSTVSQKKYILHRNANFELLIMESLYFYWKKRADNSFKLNRSNYKNELEIYLNILSENMATNAKNLERHSYSVITNSYVKNIFENYSDELTKSSIFLNAESVFRIKIIETYFVEAYTEYLEEKEGLNNFEGLKNLILSIYSKSYLGFENIKEFDLIANIFPDISEQNLLEGYVFDINKLIMKSINTLKEEDNKNELKNVSFLEKTIKIVLNNVRKN